MLSQLTANCPVTCSLGEDGAATYSDASIVSFDTTTGVIQVSESSLLTDGSSKDLTLTCTSTMSSSASATVSNTFTLEYADICRTASFSIADISPTVLSTTLWPNPLSSYPISAATTDQPACGPFEYSIITDATVASAMSVNSFGQMKIEAGMTS